MTDKRKDEMPDEIYLVINPEMEEDEESHIIWTTDPDCYPASQIMGRYTIDTNKIAIEVKIRNEAYNAGLERGKELSSALLSPPVPDDVAESIERCQRHEDYASDHPTKWGQFRIADVKTLIRAASTPSAEVRALRDAIDDVWPILQGGMTLSGLPHTAVGKIMDRLDAVLSEGE